MTNQSEHWRALGDRLGIQVMAAATVTVADQSVTFTVLLRQIGGPKGIVIDPDWQLIEPYADALTDQGYGFSCCEYGDSDDESHKEVLREWSWASSEAQPDWW
jgi:hypothetical protein